VPYPGQSEAQTIALHDVRMFNDQAGNLQVGLFGPGPFPMVVWTVPREYVDQVLDFSDADVTTDVQEDLGAIVQLRMTGGVSLHFPPGGPRHPIRRGPVDSGDPGADQGSPHVPPAGTGS